MIETELALACDLCGSTGSDLLLSNLSDRLHHLPGVFALQRCRECGLVRLSPRPASTSVHLYYPAEEYYAYERVATDSDHHRRSGLGDRLRSIALDRYRYYDGDLPLRSRVVPSRLRRAIARRATYGLEGFPRRVDRGRALDVGCGNGRFLDRLRGHGWDVIGVDTSPAAAAAANEVFGIQVLVGTLEEADLPGRSFDFIRMSHLVEHLDRPVTTLRHVARLLRPGGQIYIETPNIESLGFWWTKEYWFPLEVPRHLWLFSVETLGNALEASGFSILQLETRGFPTFIWEATYRREARAGRSDGGRRPSLRPQEAPRAAALGLAAKTIRRFTPRVGDILSCWAELSSPHRDCHERGCDTSDEDIR